MGSLLTRFVAGLAGVAALAAPALCPPAARATTIPAEPEHVVSLDSTWRFKIEQTDPVPPHGQMNRPVQPIRTPENLEPFQKPDYVEGKEWHDLAVPGNWEMAGFSPATYNQPDNAIGLYRHSFEVPAAWKGRVVKLNFDGVQNGAELFLNGQPVNVSEPAWGRANYHEAGWDAFQADLTPAVKFGEKNLLAIRVSKNTRSADMDSGDYFFLGGVYRTVTLFSVPAAHLEDVVVRTRLLEGGKAEVRTLVSASAGGGAAAGLAARVTLEGQPPADVAIGADGHGEAVTVVDHPRLWSAEHPNLYNLTVDLKDAGGQVAEHSATRVGIREISTKDGILRVNGVPIRLAGICRHDVYPTLGTALNEEIWRKDLLLMKAANINTVRTSHYPYGSRFYDLCDEMGFYVIDEMAACWVPCDTDELTPAFAQHARELVARDKNHPSVIIWAVGNENKLGKNNQVAADEIRRLDPTRPRLVSCRLADRYGTEFDDAHYPNWERIGREMHSDRLAKIPLIYTENPNNWDVRNGAATGKGPDFGSLDIWAAVLDREWQKFWPADHLAGSVLWEWQDRAVADKCPDKLYDYYPETGINLVKVKGLVDGFRNPRADYYHVKVVYAPVKVDLKPDVTASGVVVHATNYYSFTDLSELTTTWRLLKAGKELQHGSAHPALAPRTHGDLKLDLPAGAVAEADTLRLDFDRPDVAKGSDADGGNVVTYQLHLGPPPAPRPPETPAALSESDRVTFPHLNLTAVALDRDVTGWRSATRRSGHLTNISVHEAGGGSPTTVDEARLYATPLAKVRSADADVTLADDSSKDQVVGHLHVDYADRKFSYQLDWKGAETDIQELGWAFVLPKEFDTFTWGRQAYWSFYPPTHIGRPKGTARADSADVPVTRQSRPDAFDFNSTKYNCDGALLSDGKSAGLCVVFAPEGRHHCRGDFGPGGSLKLVVNKQCSPPRDISTAIVPEFYLKLKSGDRQSGSFMVGWVSGH